MDDLIKKGLLLSAGVGILAKEKIDIYLKKLESMGILNEKEAKALAKQMLAENDKQRKQFMKEVEKKVDEALKSAGVVKKSDYSKLEKKVQKLMNQLEGAKKNAKPVKKKKVKTVKKKAKPKITKKKKSRR